MQAVAATGLEADAVVGDSPACGPLAVSLGGAARVLFGAAIDEVLAAEQPYADWVLRPAAAAKPAAASP
jgi:hypothetical protein